MLFFIYWIIYYLIRLYKERDTIVIPNVGPRYKFIIVFTVCITVVTIIGTFISAQLSYNSSIQLVAYYGIFNLYIFFLVIVYAPIKAPRANGDSGMTKNQGFSEMKEHDVENFANK